MENSTFVNRHFLLKKGIFSSQLLDFRSACREYEVPEESWDPEMEAFEKRGNFHPAIVRLVL